MVFPEGPLLKLARAGEHRRQFSKAVDTFLDDKPFEAIPEIDPGTGDHTWRVHVRKPLDPGLGVLLGDTVHNLRAALDHLAWQLALLCHADPPKLTEFPIYKDARSSGHGQGFKPSGVRKMAALPLRAQVLIKRLQPYLTPEPERDWLWVIHALDIEDKHRIIPMISAASPMATATSDLSTDAMATFRWRQGAFHDGDILLRVPHASFVQSPHFFKPKFAFDLQISLTGQPLLGGGSVPLIHMCDHVQAKVFPSFEQFFD